MWFWFPVQSRFLHKGSSETSSRSFSSDLARRARSSVAAFYNCKDVEQRAKGAPGSLSVPFPCACASVHRYLKMVTFLFIQHYDKWNGLVKNKVFQYAPQWLFRLSPGLECVFFLRWGSLPVPRYSAATWVFCKNNEDLGRSCFVSHFNKRFLCTDLNNFSPFIAPLFLKVP